MAKRNWKRVRPSSLREAMELCLEFAREKHNRSIDRVADLMGLPSKWTLYKWLESGRLPANMIRPFEHACGATFMTGWIGQSAHKLVIDIPQGKAASDMDISELQARLADAMGQLIRFYKGEANADQTVAGITDVISGLAWHRENVSRQAAPELDLFSEESHG